MLKTFKVAVSGTHSTGKTTFLATLAQELANRGHSATLVHDIARDATGHKFQILRDQTWEGTLWIITRGISLELEAANTSPIVLVDRSIVDAFGYLLAALSYRGEELPQYQYQLLQTLVAQYTKTYSIILKTEIDPTITIDQSKSRDNDPALRTTVHDLITKIYTECNIPYRTLTIANRLRTLQMLIADTDSFVKTIA